jgi:hypothetical protein
METKTIIVKAAALVTVITGLFGGFLLNITPPDNEGQLISEFSQGIFSSIILCLVLLFWAYSAYFKKSLNPRMCIRICIILIIIFFISSLGYFFLFQTFTYLEPISQTEYIRHLHGYTFTANANDWISKNPSLSKVEMIKNFAYNPEYMWDDKSTNKIQYLFFVVYLIISTTLSAAIVCLSELICNSKAS